MADYEFSTLKDKYRAFANPHAEISIGGKMLRDVFPSAVLTDLKVDITSGFEASVASFCLYNVYNISLGEFDVDNLKNSVTIGTSVSIALGYDIEVTTIFVGAITKVNFVYEDPELPYLMVTCMDIKGIMMANNYSKQLEAKYYGKAVEEIFQKAVYQKVMGKGMITDVSVSATPDDPTAAPETPAPGEAAAPSTPTKPNEAATIEMVAESDYEFVVKAAKKYNFEFFVSAGVVVFRPAKADTGDLIAISPQDLLRSFDIEYDITGQVSGVEVRATDSAKGELISSKKDISNTWSVGSNADALVKGNKKIYIDPTVHDQKEADARAKFLAEDIAYRFGTLNCETLGVPELIPGKFIIVFGLGNGIDNRFYLTSVTHVMTKDGEYKCVLKGKAAAIIP